MTAELTAADLRAGYGSFDVLHGLDLHVRSGELTAIVGPNGAGKTTLLKALSGLLPWRGEVTFDGSPMARTTPSEVVGRGLVLVPEGRQLFAQMSVRDNLELGGWLVPRSERRGLLGRIFDAFPRLRERSAQLAGTMSGGEQQLVALARGLMGRPKLLMLDEPSLGLAPKMVDEIFVVLRRICDDGVTVLLVEQNVSKVLTIADRACVIERGRVVASGSASDIRNSDIVKNAYLGTTT